MHFFSALLVGAAAFASHAVAQTSLAFTSVPSAAAVGQATVVRYTSGDTTSPVTITLRKGNPLNLDTVGVLTSSATGGSYTWVPDASLASGSDYALQITQGNQINYSGQFPVTGGSAAAVSSASAATSAPVSSASSMLSVATANSTRFTFSTTTSGSVAIVIANATTTASMSASSAMARNSTMSMATLTASTTTTVAGAGSASASGASSAASGASSAASGAGASSRASSASSSPSSSSSIVPSNDASGLHSPLALIFGAVAAMVYLN